MDPLSPSNINPSWSTSPPPSSSSYTPSRHIPPPSPIDLPPSQPSPSFSREAKVFGAPTPGILGSSSGGGHGVPSGGGVGAGAGAGGAKEKLPPFLRVRIGGLERNRKDLLIRFDASTNLPNFRLSVYRNMQRSYVEFQRFAEQAALCNPQTIIPALPLSSTSAVTDEEDDRLVRIALQRWFARICEDPVLLKDDELRSFIESDFGYSPVPPLSARRPASSTSAVPMAFTAALSKVVRRGPLDQDDELAIAKGALERLEERWGGAAAAVGALGKNRRAMALANADVGAKLISLATVEPEPQLATAERKIGRVYEQLSGMSGAQAASENVVLSDSLGYQALNARSAKETLIQRTHILEDSQSATKSAITKRRNLERLKGSSSINPGKVDDALSEMEEANALEHQLSSRLNAISTNLHQSLRTHSQQAHEDVALALLEHARMSVMYGRQVLRELEALRPDLARVGPNPQGMSVASTPITTHQPLPSMVASQPYQSQTPVQQPHQASRQQLPPSNGPIRSTAPPPGSQSMFLPPPTQQTPPRSQQQQHQQQQQQTRPNPDPLGGQMTQSMMLPSGQGQRAQTIGRGPKRLDERQVAKMLAGGF